MRPYLFCPRCGVGLEGGVRCPSCGEMLIPRPTPAVAMAVVESHQILLVRRRYAPMVGHWALPAGYVEAGEDPARTVRREVAEETGLQVRPAGLLGAYPGGGQDGRVILLVYRGVVEGGRLEAGDDALEAGFFPLHRLPAPFAFGPHRIVLDLLQRADS